MNELQDHHIKHDPKIEEELENLEAPNIFAEFFLFLKEEKVWWMAPLLVVFMIFGAIMVVGQSVPGIAPFIYTLF